MRSRIFVLMMGSLSSTFMLGVCNFGSTFFLIIFSMMRGTEIMIVGLISPKALSTILGEGIRVR